MAFRPSPLDPLGHVIGRQYKTDPAIKNKLFGQRLAHAKNLFRKDLLAHYGCVNAIEFSSDGDIMASGGDDRRVLVWAVTEAMLFDGTPVVMETNHASNIFCLGFDSAGMKLFSGGNDDQVIMHDIVTRHMIRQLPHKKPVYGLSVNPHNDQVVATAGDDGRILIFDVRESRNADALCLAKQKTGFHSVMFNPTNPRWVLTANSDEGIALWDCRKPKELYLQYDPKAGSANGISACFNAKGNRVLALRRRLPPVLYDTQTDSAICQFYHPQYYNSCTMKTCSFAGNDDEYVLSGSDDFNLYMWRVPQDPGTEWGRTHLVLRGHRSIVNQVRYNKQNNLIASSGVEKMVKLWSALPVGRWTGSLQTEHFEFPRAIYSHEDYIYQVGHGGERISHDYSDHSTMEDSKMMAFFDSLIQRELEQWESSSPPSPPDEQRNGMGSEHGVVVGGMSPTGSSDEDGNCDGDNDDVDKSSSNEESDNDSDNSEDSDDSDREERSLAKLLKIMFPNGEVPFDINNRLRSNKITELIAKKKMRLAKMAHEKSRSVVLRNQSKKDRHHRKKKTTSSTPSTSARTQKQNKYKKNHNGAHVKNKTSKKSSLSSTSSSSSHNKLPPPPPQGSSSFVSSSSSSSSIITTAVLVAAAPSSSARREDNHSNPGSNNTNNNNNNNNNCRRSSRGAGGAGDILKRLFPANQHRQQQQQGSNCTTSGSTSTTGSTSNKFNKNKFSKNRSNNDNSGIVEPIEGSSSGSTSSTTVRSGERKYRTRASLREKMANFDCNGGSNSPSGAGGASSGSNNNNNESTTTDLCNINTSLDAPSTSTGITGSNPDRVFRVIHEPDSDDEVLPNARHTQQQRNNRHGNKNVNNKNFVDINNKNRHGNNRNSHNNKNNNYYNDNKNDTNKNTSNTNNNNKNNSNDNSNGNMSDDSSSSSSTTSQSSDNTNTNNNNNELSDEDPDNNEDGVHEINNFVNILPTPLNGSHDMYIGVLEMTPPAGPGSHSNNASNLSNNNNNNNNSGNYGNNSLGGSAFVVGAARGRSEEDEEEEGNRQDHGNLWDLATVPSTSRQDLADLPTAASLTKTATSTGASIVTSPSSNHSVANNSFSRSTGKKAGGIKRPSSGQSTNSNNNNSNTNKNYSNISCSSTNNNNNIDSESDSDFELNSNNYRTPVKKRRCSSTNHGFSASTPDSGRGSMDPCCSSNTTINSSASPGFSAKNSSTNNEKNSLKSSEFSGTSPTASSSSGFVLAGASSTASTSNSINNEFSPSTNNNTNNNKEPQRRSSEKEFNFEKLRKRQSGKSRAHIRKKHQRIAYDSDSN